MAYSISVAQTYALQHSRSFKPLIDACTFIILLTYNTTIPVSNPDPYPTTSISNVRGSYR